MILTLFSLTVYGDSNTLLADMRPAKRPLPNTPQNNNRTMTVNFVLMRSVTRYRRDFYVITFAEEYTIKTVEIYCLLLPTVLYRIIFLTFQANVPCVNNVDSLIMALERYTLLISILTLQDRSCLED